MTLKPKPMNEAGGYEMRARKGHATKKIRKAFWNKLENYFKNK